MLREFNALFGRVRGFSINRTLIHDGKGERDSVLLIYIKKEKRLNVLQIDKWFRARFNKDSVVVVID